MKKLTVLLFTVLMVSMIGVFNTNEVKAISINFDFTMESPRFQYMYDENNIIVPFNFYILEHFDNYREIENIDISLDQVTYDGVYIKNLAKFTSDYEVYNSNVANVLASFTSTSSNDYDDEYIGLSDLDYIEIQYVLVNSILLSEYSWSVNETLGFLTIEGQFVNSGDAISVQYSKEFSTVYTDNLIYDWSNLSFTMDNEVAFYRISYGDIILMSGGVMRQPIGTLDYDDYGIEFGEYLYNSNGLPDFTDQVDFTTFTDRNKNNFLILHYRIPQALWNVSGYKVIRVTDIINNTTEESFTTLDILLLQQTELGPDAPNHLNSFIVLPINGILPEGLKTDYSYYDGFFDPFLHIYGEGSYYFAMLDQLVGYNFLAGANAVWNVVAENTYPFELTRSLNELTIDELQRLTFYKNSDIICSGYTSTTAEDIDLGVSYIDYIDATLYTYGASYYPLDTLEVGAIGQVRWYLEPSFMPFSLDPADFTIELSETYIIIDSDNLTADIDTIRNSLGMGDNIGGMIFSILSIILIDLLLLKFSSSSFIIAITDLVLVSIFSYLGFVSMWFVVGIVILGLIGIKINLGKGDASYE